MSPHALATLLEPRSIAVVGASTRAVGLFLEIVRDPQLGPVVTIASGGIYTETLNDVVFARPPFDAHATRRLLERLKLYPLLTGTRSGERCDIDSFCETAAAFSALVVALQPVLREIDINPLLVGSNDSICVDAHMSRAMLPAMGAYTLTHEERRYDA